MGITIIKIRPFHNYFNWIWRIPAKILVFEGGPSVGLLIGDRHYKDFITMVTLSWWRFQMETFSALLALCAGNSPVTGEFPAQRPVMRSFDIFFDLRLNKRLNKQSRRWWFETPSRLSWRHCYDRYHERCRSHRGCPRLYAGYSPVAHCRPRVLHRRVPAHQDEEKGTSQEGTGGDLWLPWNGNPDNKNPVATVIRAFIQHFSLKYSRNS